MAKIVAILGMPGSGKSEAVKYFTSKGFYRVYFGGVVIDELRKARLPVNEANERMMREKLRKEHGMAAMAKLSMPEIEKGLREAGKVVIESMYSFEEYKMLKENFGDAFATIAICASPQTRYARLAKRPVRPLAASECQERDYSQLENLNQGAPIALADFTVVNEGSLNDLRAQLDSAAKKLGI